MFRLIGVILIISGSIGAAAVICREDRKRIEMLKQIRLLYENIQYLIGYQKATVPEILLRISEKKTSPFAESCREIYEELLDGRRDFEVMWRQSLTKRFPDTSLQKKDWQLLLRFPSCLGFMEGSIQAKALDELLRETGQSISLAEKEEQSRQKVIMSLGMAAGVLLAILLI